jgi:hypothetical protein
VRLITADRDEALRSQAMAAGVGIIYTPIDTRALERFIAQVAERGKGSVGGG